MVFLLEVMMADCGNDFVTGVVTGGDDAVVIGGGDGVVTGGANGVFTGGDDG